MTREGPSDAQSCMYVTHSLDRYHMIGCGAEMKDSAAGRSIGFVPDLGVNVILSLYMSKAQSWPNWAVLKHHVDLVTSAEQHRLS
jgi:hypothetical protein